MAELKAAPLFGSVRLQQQRLARGYYGADTCLPRIRVRRRGGSRRAFIRARVLRVTGSQAADARDDDDDDAIMHHPRRRTRVYRVRRG